jgi:hypothetical protein
MAINIGMVEASARQPPGPSTATKRHGQWLYGWTRRAGRAHLELVASGGVSGPTTIAVMQNSEYGVGWATLTFINAGLAQSKGRGGLTWWLVSLFLGPLATALIVVLPRVN